jgi:dihydrodipicolinate reductase
MNKSPFIQKELEILHTRLHQIDENTFIDSMLQIIRNATGKVYSLHVDVEEKKETKHPVTAQDFLEAIAKVQSNRGAEYEEQSKEERSFAKVAASYNAIRDTNLAGSDIALIQAQLKFVRQYSNPERIHHDSLLDAPSYTVLWSSELMAEAAEKQQCLKTNPSSE